jgi:hypothetical protein
MAVVISAIRKLGAGFGLVLRGLVTLVLIWYLLMVFGLIIDIGQTLVSWPWWVLVVLTIVFIYVWMPEGTRRSCESPPNAQESV